VPLATTRKEFAIEEQQDRRVRKTRRAIRQALETLLLDKAVDQITAKEIAAEADIGYTTFFRHFASKEDALADLADAEAGELIEHCFPLLRSADSLTATVGLCRHVESRKRVWTALLTSGAAGMVRKALIEHTLEHADEWPPGQPWLPADTGTQLVTGLVVEVLTWWLTHAPGMKPAQIAEIMERLFIAALVEPRA